MTRLACLTLIIACTTLGGGAQEPVPPTVDPLHKAFDAVLDVYVRDGLVYYRALKLERERFDRYVASLGDA